MDNDWILTAEQFVWMLQHEKEIDIAYDAEQMQPLRDLMHSSEFKRVFGDMGFDEAYDRFEEMVMSDPLMSFRQGWKEMMQGKTIPYVSPKKDES